MELVNDPLYQRIRTTYNECAIASAVLDLILRDWRPDGAQLRDLTDVLTEVRSFADAGLEAVSESQTSREAVAR